MSFLRTGTRLRNGSKSGAYIYGDGTYINIHISIPSKKRRHCGEHVKLTYEELIYIAQSCLNRGWLKKANP